MNQKAGRSRLERSFHITAEALANRSGIRVTHGGKTAYAKPGGRINLPSLPIESPEAHTLGLGYVSHEIGHVNVTDFDAIRKVKRRPFKKRLLNILEDHRIEGYAIRTWPGAFRVLLDTREILHHQGKLGAAHPEHGMAGVLLNASLAILNARLYQDGNSDLLKDAANASETVLLQMFPEQGPAWLNLLGEADSLHSTHEALDLTERLFDLVAQENPQPKSNDDGDLKPSDSEGSEDESEEDSTDQSTGGDSGDDPEDESDKDDGGGNASDESDEDSDEGSEDEANDGADAGDESEDESDENDGGGNSSDESDEDPEDESGDGGKGDADDDAEEDSEDSAGGDNASGESEDESSEDSAGEDSGDESGNETQSQSGSDESGDGAGDIQDQLDEEAEDLDSFDLGDSLGKSIEEKSHRANPDQVPSEMMAVQPSDKSNPETLAENARAATTALRMKMRTLLESVNFDRRSTRRKGRKIRSRHLARAGMNDDRIFEKRTTSSTPNTAVEVLVDRSGSMMGETIVKAMTSAYALQSALEETKGVTAQTTTFPYPWGDGVGVIVPFGSRARPNVSRFWPYSGGSTPMGSAMLRSGMNLVQRSEPRKILLVLTDGEPNCTPSAEQAIEMAREAGIEVFGIGIGDDVNVEELFGDRWAARVHDLGDLAPEMFRILRKSLAQAA
ncbi:VWA domain-containing protein [Thioalkalivibrio sp. ALE19]|uniref:VWA domain-containing protein n=2 Tax=unclassified Thioalkalivibrio TaxID=2621013 RepID=UPI0018CB4921|nr:VWA domain-containing protein [Thioalkalivibrio sp. ALE19]